MTPSQLTRVGAVAAVALLAACALSVLLPVKADGVDCGRWVSPTYGDAEAAELTRTAGILGAERKAEIVGSLEACDSAVSTRRTITIALGVGAPLVPLVLWWVGARMPGRRPEPAA